MPDSILLIEDNSDIARVLQTIMRFEGFQVVHERDGLRALDKALRTGWAAIVLDLGLPRLSGWEILDGLRSRFGEKAPPVIVVSASAEAVTREEALSRGAVEYLVKPVTADVIAMTIRRFTPAKEHDAS